MSRRDICKCGHILEDHAEGCSRCGFGECYGKLRKGNNNDFCECEEYQPAELKRKRKENR